jgi:Flp pilus assembly protein TadD
VATLERVVELDPTIADAWPALGAAYRALGNGKAAEALRDRYQQRFGKPPTFK